MSTLNTLIQYHPISTHHYFTLVRNNLLSPKPLALQPFSRKKKNATKKCRDHSFVRQCTQKPAENDTNEPPKSPEGLYASVKNQDFRELFDLMRNASSNPFAMYMLKYVVKQKGLVIFASIAAFIANHLEVVIKPTTTKEGPDVGFRWQFEWKNFMIPLGPATSLYTTHMYTGRILMRNGKSMIQPILNLGPLTRQMLLAALPMLASFQQQIGSRGELKAAVYSLLTLFLMAISFALWRNKFGVM